MRLFLLISFCNITLYSCTNGKTNISQNAVQLPAADKNNGNTNNISTSKKATSDNENYSGKDCDQQTNCYTNPRMMLW